MTTYPITIVNPGAESGTTGWSLVSGTFFSSNTATPHSGSRRFLCDTNAFTQSSVWQQTIAVDPSDEAALDAGLYSLHASAWHMSAGEDRGKLYLKAYDADMALLSSTESVFFSETSWTEVTLSLELYPGTRFIIIGTDNVATTADGVGMSSAWDDFSLWFDDTPAVSGNASQLGVYSLGSQPADSVSLFQGGGYVAAAAETSNTFHDVMAHQLGAYALVKGLVDRRDLRAWTFTQDDHDFYVLQLGDESTLVYDKLSGQWARWNSPDFIYWRGQDGCDWEGYNICCDTESGVLWEIDPEGRLDYGTTPIRSQVTGQLTERFRGYVNCYMAELAVSEAFPPASIDASTVGITLRTYDSNSLNSVTHGEVLGEAIGENITVRWYGLGLMQAPGRVFEITDTGYARRIDGLNLEIGSGLK